MKKEESHMLDCLIGEQLSAVQFVQDYLQLHFDAYGLTCYVWPDIIINRYTFKFGDNLYRDKLCSLISNVVKWTLIEENEVLTIEFEGDSKIDLSLDPANPKIIGEIAIFHFPDGNIAVFE
jgi:hypothetical protein